MKDTLAVVTGSGSGMGRAIAIEFASEGRSVAVLDRNLAGAEETVALIKKAGGEATAFEVDISSEESVLAARDKVEAKYGSALILVNCAGWEEIYPFMETTPDFRSKIISINLIGAFSITHAFLKGMIEAGRGGRVVNISSDAGRVGSSYEVAYSGAKGGLIGFTKALAREMARHQITVNCVCPGPTDTPMLHSAPTKYTDSLAKIVPLRRIGTAEDISNAVVFFANEKSGFITGQTLSVSGGLTMAG